MNFLKILAKIFSPYLKVNKRDVPLVEWRIEGKAINQFFTFYTQKLRPLWWFVENKITRSGWNRFCGSRKNILKLLIFLEGFPVGNWFRSKLVVTLPMNRKEILKLIFILAGGGEYWLFQWIKSCGGLVLFFQIRWPVSS